VGKGLSILPVAWVFEVGESSKGGDLEGGVVGHPKAVEVSRSCNHTMGVSYGGD